MLPEISRLDNVSHLLDIPILQRYNGLKYNKYFRAIQRHKVLLHVMMS